MSIPATTSTTVSATYNLWAVANLQISGDGCVAYGQGPATPGAVAVNAVLVKARVLPSGAWERSPAPGDVARLTIPDVYAYIATGTTQAQAVQSALSAILTALQSVGTQQGVL